MNFSFFTVFLKNRNISSKIKRSKVTDYAALHLTNRVVRVRRIRIRTGNILGQKKKRRYV